MMLWLNLDDGGDNNDHTEQDHAFIIASRMESRNRPSEMDTWLAEIRQPAETPPPVELPEEVLLLLLL